MTDFPAELTAAATRILAEAERQGAKIATAESCTGGLVAAVLTAIEGSSAAVECGFVTYSNAAKQQMLGVPAAVLREHGAVSAPVAAAMAEGALARSGATLSVAVTGIAGPGGGSEEKPVGLVQFACARSGRPTITVEHRFGAIGRREVRHRSVEVALALLVDALDAQAGAAPRP